MSLNEILLVSPIQRKPWQVYQSDGIYYTTPSGSSLMVVDPGAQGNHLLRVRVVTPSTALQTYQIPDIGGDGFFVVASGAPPAPGVPYVSSGPFTFNPTVVVTGSAGPTWLAYRTLYTQIGNIYTLGIGGAISISGASGSPTGIVSLSVPLTSLPGYPPGPAGGINQYPGGSLTYQISHTGAGDALSDGFGASVEITSPNLILSFGWVNGAPAFSIGDKIYINATVMYSVP